MRSAESLRGLVDLCCYVRERAGSDLCVVELGSLVGESTFELALHFRRVVAIDTWDYPNSELIYDNGEIERYFDRVVEYHGNIVKAKKESVSAAGEWKGPLVDLLYIDANHRYEAVKADLLAWLPLMRGNGFVAGHDYGDTYFDGVRKAVDEILGPPDRVFGDTSWIKRVA